LRPPALDDSTFSAMLFFSAMSLSSGFSSTGGFPSAGCVASAGVRIMAARGRLLRGRFFPATSPDAVGMAALSACLAFSAFWACFSSGFLSLSRAGRLRFFGAPRLPPGESSWTTSQWWSRISSSLFLRRRGRRPLLTDFLGTSEEASAFFRFWVYFRLAKVFAS